MNKHSKSETIAFIKILQQQVDKIDNINFYMNPNTRISKLFDAKVIQINEQQNKRNITVYFELMIVFPLRYLYVVNLAVFSSVINAWNHIKMRNEIEEYKKSLNKKNIVIGHATARNASSLEKNNKNFDLNKDFIEKTLWVYIDHTGKLNLFRRKPGDISKSIVILPKTMGLIDLKSFLMEMTKLYLTLIKVNKTNSDNKFLINRVRNYLISGQLSVQSFSNFRLTKQVEFISATINSNYVYFPIEGHAVEEYLNSLFDNKSPEKRIVFYQTSPFTKDQPGIAKFIEKNKIPSNKIIKVNNLVSKKYIEDLNPSIVIKLDKMRKKTHICDLDKEFILLAPENFEYENLKFVQLAKQLLLINLDYKILFRLHPDYKMSSNFKKQLAILKREEYFKLSDDNLENDLCRSSALFYSGSSVSLNAIRHRTLPIYYENDFDFNTDPILDRIRYNLPSLRNNLDNLRDILCFNYLCDFLSLETDYYN